MRAAVHLFITLTAAATSIVASGSGTSNRNARLASAAFVVPPTVIVTRKLVHATNNVVRDKPGSSSADVAKPYTTVAAAKIRSTDALRIASTSPAALPQDEDQLPPRDESFNPIAAVRELLAAPEQPKGADRFDRIGVKTGGIWRGKGLGLVPCTVIAAPTSTQWITKEEARGNIDVAWPPSFVQLVGPKTILNIGEAHPRVRRVFSEALSPKETLKMQSIIENALDNYLTRWEKFAASGEKVPMTDEINAYTLEVISRCLLGDYVTKPILSEIVRDFPVVCNGIISVPRRLPWPLRLVPVFSFGQSMDARDEFKKILAGMLRERRADMKAERQGLGPPRNGGLLDPLMEMQQEQIDAGGPVEGDIEFDDEFIFDNIIGGLFGGFDTTSVSLQRIVQCLGTPDGKAVVGQLMEELDETVTTSDEKNLDDAKPLSGIFGSFPLLNAVVLETYRMYPVITGVFRKAVKDLKYNGYLIPAGKTINWILFSGFRAKSLYPQPETFCPFRFLHEGKGNKVDADTTATAAFAMSTAEEDTPTGKKGQPRPEMFGFGKHMCPGRELAKLEILLFLRMFLNKFDYDMVEGQSFKSTLPVNAPKDKLQLVIKARSAV